MPAPPKDKSNDGPKLAAGTQEGSRWIDRRPDGAEVASWFAANVRMHDGLEPAHYVGGVTLIGANEHLKEVREAKDGSKQQVDVQRYTWTPYVKIETRVAYFWDLMAKDDDVVGAIEPVDSTQLDTAGVYNMNLPKGFFRLPVQVSAHEFVHFIGSVMQVKVYRKDTLEWVDIRRTVTDPDGKKVDEVVDQVLRGIPIAIYPPATKQIAMLKKGGDEDPFAVMKAETGAVGRALGMAGMLVIPGSGIATAEDMQEVQAGASGGATPGDASLPVAAPVEPETTEDVAAGIQGKIAHLQSTSAPGYEQLAAWAKERKIDLEKPTGTQLRGLELQVDRIIANA